MMMDLWGNVPVTTQFGDTTTAKTTARADVFKFIEKELNESIPNLSEMLDKKPTVAQLSLRRMRFWQKCI
jgi:hypothetical protein